MGQKNATTGGAAGRLLALLSACFICTHARVDPDLWGHLRFGLDALTNGRLSITDPYSFTQDVPWINHEWLSEVAQAIAYRAGGVLGLVLLKAALLASAFGILARETGDVEEPARWWLLAAGIIGVAPAAFTMRPQIWTLLAIPILWRALNQPGRGWTIPIVFALWANLHGGWIVGMGIAGLWVIGSVIDRLGRFSDCCSGRPSGRPWDGLKPVPYVLIGLISTLINPYGWRLWQFLLTTVRPSRAISEWRPVWQQDDWTAALVWAAIVGVIVVPTLLRRRSAITWAGLLPAAWLGVMGLFVARLVPLFGEVALLGLAGAWRTTAVSRRPIGRFVIVDAAMVAAIAAFNLIGETRCLPIAPDNWTPDLRAASALASPAAEGRLVLPFNWGEYAIWHFGPRLKVSIDGRRETVYSDRVVDLQSAVAHGQPAGLEYLQVTRPEFVWLPSTTGATVAAWLKARDYRVDVDTGASFIATRRDRPALTMGAAMPACFP